jgi:hypothetical protein
MKPKYIYLIGLAIVITLLIALPSFALPQSAPEAVGYSIDWYTIDGGGATFSTGPGGYSLGGTIGQADAGSMSGSGYTLVGGYWGGAAINYNVYLPLVLKNF